MKHLDDVTARVLCEAILDDACDAQQDGPRGTPQARSASEAQAADAMRGSVVAAAAATRAA